MDNSNKKKYDLLGMPFGTATNQLRKAIMFQLIQKIDEDICYRCGKRIESIEDLSIEHKTAWQSAQNPKEAFFNLENIAFSHLRCNINAGDKTGEKNRIGKAGLKGVTFHSDRKLKKPYQAIIKENGKSIHKGYFETAEQASNAYKKAINKKIGTIE